MTTPSTTPPTKPFPFLNLPTKLQDGIRFNSGLSDHDSLSLDAALASTWWDELRLVDSWLEGCPEVQTPVLAVFQTLYAGGAMKGSADWPRYDMCKRLLFLNPTFDPLRQHIRIGCREIRQVLDRVHTISDLIRMDATWDNIDRFKLRAAHNDRLRFPFRAALWHDRDWTDTELVRLALAVNQYIQWMDLLRQDAQALRYEEADLLATNFLRHLTPWEREQLLCISEIVSINLYQQVLGAMEHHIEFRSWMRQAYQAAEGDLVCRQLLGFYRKQAKGTLSKHFRKLVLFRAMSAKVDLRTALAMYGVGRGPTGEYPGENEGVRNWEQRALDFSDEFRKVIGGQNVVGAPHLAVPWSALLQGWICTLCTTS